MVYWLGAYGCTYDPRLPGEKFLPFKPFPKQIELLYWLKEREEAKEYGIIEKSRDSGASYLCCAYALHGWLFTPGYSVGFGSRKEDLVDKIGDPDSLFEKIRILLSRLPNWQLPVGFSEKEHVSHMKIVNPQTGATITGEAGKNIGRGGRKSIYFVDESAYLEQPDLIERSLSDTTNVRIDISTPNGPGNPFAKKRFSNKFKVFTFHWKDDPRKNHTQTLPDGRIIYPWYEEYKSTRDPVTVAQEADIDYSASIEGICIPALWVRSAVGFVAGGAGGAGGLLIGGFDPADGGRSRSVLIARRGTQVLEPLSWGHLSAGQAAGMARLEAERLGINIVHYDAIGVGTSVQDAWEHADTRPKFERNGVKWGAPPTENKWPSGKTSVEMFSNLRTELWWIMRTRFEKTYQVAVEGQHYPPDELISIPNCQDLIAELSLPLIHTTSTGKLQLESKEDMAKRGVSSPDFADALAYTFAPYRLAQGAPVVGGQRTAVAGFRPR